MFEFSYTVDLVVIHPAIDPQVISVQLTELSPSMTARAGTPSRTAAGEIRDPPRLSKLSVWSAPLHESRRLHSKAMPLSSFLREQLQILRRHAVLFRELSEQGTVALNIGWFSDSSHSADILDVDVVAACAELSLAIELNYYAPPNDPA